jgi:MerR family transcriptional regulator, thiopeptide resistance regulator
MKNPAPLWKIGELAAKTGLTVRTLHHYEEIGLLSPSHRTESNHRLYDAADIARLQQIVSLKNLGFSLEQIKDSLGKPGFDLAAVLQMHLGKMREQMKKMQALTERLDGLVRFSQSGAPAAGDLLKAMALMRDVETQWTDEELETIRAQGRKIGREGMVSAEQEWPALMAQVQAHLESNTDVTDPDVQRIAKRWKELVAAFTGGNPQIAAKLRKMYEEKPKKMQQFGGPSAEMRAYVQRAIDALHD